MDTSVLDRTTRALADPTRREILDLVRVDEHTASGIAGRFTVSRPAVSQHLRVLQEAELLSCRTEGTRRWYRARPEGLGDLRAWLDGFWTAGLQRLKTEVEQSVTAEETP